ncbi:hypothetical protein Plec18167_006538, partial [Paecilomyces lecythidis]
EPPHEVLDNRLAPDFTKAAIKELFDFTVAYCIIFLVNSYRRKVVGGESVAERISLLYGSRWAAEKSVVVCQIRTLVDLLDGGLVAGLRTVPTV